MSRYSIARKIAQIAAAAGAPAERLAALEVAQARAAAEAATRAAARAQGGRRR